MSIPRILDGHIHLTESGGIPTDFAARQATAGVGGGLIISQPPAAFGRSPGGTPAAARLDHVMEWCQGGEYLFPFFWIDPLEEDAQSQVQAAAKSGVAGFKVICGHHRPGHPAAMEVYRAVAASGRPLLFHSGILWDGKPSSPFNRPAEFEVLLEVTGLRFALAHISWPWCDELIAMYGKVQNACTDHGAGVAMYIDTTPGTPPIYRRDALTRLFTVGYDVRDRVMFGTDSRGEDYNATWTASWIRRDRKILADLGVDEDGVDRVLGGNLLRFLGQTEATNELTSLRPGV